ncbi:MAG TPA: DNA-3-methyladenine glycosylase I [Acidimicrobiia bacterium]|nr:DNA-3-methyladenine glycosylase I [Acidimicrobiia bacterium]
MPSGLSLDQPPVCWWGASPPIYRDYHDQEWGRPITEDARLFEKLCLEGFQAGLSWLTILRKRPAFRTAFAGFDPVQVASFGLPEIEMLMQNEGIVRHRGKIESTINNACRALDLRQEFGSLASYFWRFAAPPGPPPEEIPAATEASVALARDLKKRRFSFVGPTTVYAFMQSMGLVNDHLAGCWVRAACEEERTLIWEKTRREA